MQNNIFGAIGLLVITQLLGPHDFDSMKIIVIGDQKLVAIIFSIKYLLLCWEEQKKIHRGLEQFEFKYMMTVSLLLGELSF